MSTGATIRPAPILRERPALRVSRIRPKVGGGAQRNFSDVYKVYIISFSLLAIWFLFHP
jgi:hypothetical protein